MADSRICHIVRETTDPASDDYFVMDGETNNTRKISASFFRELDGLCYDLQGKEISKINRYILLDGSTSFSNSWNLFVFDTSTFFRKLKLFSRDRNALLVAFYDSETLDSNSFISGIQSANHSNAQILSFVDIPKNAVRIAVCTRIATSTDHEIIGFKDNLKKLLEITEISNDVERIKTEAMAEEFAYDNVASDAVKNEGYRWTPSTWQLDSNAEFCATSLTCEPNTTYKLVGARIGSGGNYRIHFLNSNGARLSEISNLPIADYVEVTTPNDCVEIRYTQLWNSPLYQSLYGQFKKYKRYINVGDFVPLLDDTSKYKRAKGSLGNYIVGISSEGEQTIRNGSDSCFINRDGVDYKLTFFAGADNFSDQVELRVQAFGNGYTNYATYIRIHTHQFGHCNTVTYNAPKDALIFGNGSGESSLLGKFYVIENASDKFLNAENGHNFTLQNTNAIEYDCSALSFGTKLNVLWGETNGLNANIAYAITDDNKYIRKLLLGTGTNQFELGTYTAADDGKFNGTFKVIKTYTREFSESASSMEHNQGSEYRDGKIICGIGSSSYGLRIWAMCLNDEDEKIYVDDYRQFIYKDDGTVRDTSINGLCFDKEGNLIVGTIYTSPIGSTLAFVFPKKSF